MQNNPKIRFFFLFIIYQVLTLLILPFMPIIFLVRKLRKKPVFGSFKERIGLIPKAIKNQNVIWIHAVSVGEILSIQDLINQLKQKTNKITIYVTTGTLSGKKIAAENLKCDHLSFLPLDFFICMFLAFKRINPKSIIIVEAETWPNFLMTAKLFKVPIYSINARISERSKGKYKKLSFFFQPLLNIFKTIFVQSPTDKLNFEKLGVNRSKLEILGNIKALNVLQKKEAITETYLIDKNFQILLVGSIHPGELDVYLNLFSKLKIKFPKLKLILAPRHFGWQQELINKTQATNFSYFFGGTETKLSEEDFLQKVIPQNDIILICKLGELFKLYPLCTIFFLGGTFVPVGGHNLLEPAVWAKFSIVGPHYQNCKDIADKLEQQEALAKVSCPEELISTTEKMLSNPIQLEQAGKKAYFWLEQEASLVQNKLDLLIKELKS